MDKDQETMDIPQSHEPSQEDTDKQEELTDESLEETTKHFEQLAEENRRNAEATRKLKRKIIIAIIVMVVFAAIAIPVISVLDGAGEDENKAPYKPPNASGVDWYPPDYDRKVNILKDPDYLELDRHIDLKRGAYTITLDTDKLTGYSPAVVVLCDMIDTIIRGDAEAYNRLFSERYFKEGNEPEAPFTMQRIYDIQFDEIREKIMTDENGQEYNEYIYRVTYKINRNDGTFRLDIGHDVSIPQYFLLSDRSGEVMIDRLMYLEP